MDAQTYTTTNLYSAAALLTVGADFVGTARATDGRIGFVFADPDGQLAKLDTDYKRGRLQPVQARTLIDSLMIMRDALSAATGR